jgi:hypothetical protein
MGELGKRESEEFDLEKGCQYQCELLVRYGIPCRHWMYVAYSRECQLPLSLFHPRWPLYGPVVVRRRWKMTWDKDDLPLPRQLTLEGSDRFRKRGTEMVKTIALAVVHNIRKLTS